MVKRLLPVLTLVAFAGSARAQRRERPDPARPDPGVTYAIPVGNSPFRGPRHAKVTMVIACQFTGPFCKRIRPTVDTLIARYGRDLKVVYKSFPVHVTRATIPALAACAAHRQGKYFEMDHLLWTSVMADADWSRRRMRSEAEALHLDLHEFDADMDGICKKVVADEQAEMRRFGVGGTPATFVNGRFLGGALPIVRFETLIDEELAKANRRIHRRRDVARYYRKWVLGRGEKRLEPRAEAGP